MRFADCQSFLCQPIRQWLLRQTVFKEKNARLGTWPRGVTVSTLDSESSDRGPNPREAFQECQAMFGVVLVRKDNQTKRP